ncbi:MAG: hypothetical protein ACLPVF_01020 [Acidimicrobiales bacterium]
MTVEFDPSAIRAVLTSGGDHWVVAIESATSGSWGKAETAWSSNVISREEVRDQIGDERIPSDQDAIECIEVMLRRAGWRAARSGHVVTPPSLEVWDLSPASEYGRPKNLFS